MPPPHSGTSPHHASPARRWVLVALRTLHLVAALVLGAAVLSAPLTASASAAGVVLATGLAMFALDLISRPSHLREVAGLAVIVKLALTGWMVVQPALAMWIFWAIVVVSGVISHAPKGFRHRAVIGRG